jgi:O-methyltransferase
MTSPERLFALRQSVIYLVQHNIPGAFVECGVWRGGSMMAVALTLLEFGVTNRHLYLYDTFDGMSAPTERDRTFAGVSASDLPAATDKATDNMW